MSMTTLRDKGSPAYRFTACRAGSGIFGAVDVTFPENDNSYLIRTDFSDDDAWRALCEAASAPSDDEFEADFTFIDDRQLDGATVETLLAVLPHTIAFFVADTRTFTDSEHPILVVDHGDADGDRKSGATFRVIPSEVWGPQNNLHMANMDFDEFASSADSDGVFRGFD
jgi:hypothetical protein